jgi:hypothetical protein
MALSLEQRTLSSYSGPEVHEYGEDMFVYLYYLDRTQIKDDAQGEVDDS